MILITAFRWEISAIRQLLPRPQAGQEEAFFVGGCQLPEGVDSPLYLFDQGQHIRSLESFRQVVSRRGGAILVDRQTFLVSSRISGGMAKPAGNPFATPFLSVPPPKDLQASFITVWAKARPRT